MPKEKSTARIDARSRALYDAILTYKAANDGDWPGIRELSRLTGISSTSNVVAYLRRLDAAGLIRRAAGARAYCVVGGHWHVNAQEVPEIPADLPSMIAIARAEAAARLAAAGPLAERMIAP